MRRRNLRGLPRKETAMKRLVTMCVAAALLGLFGGAGASTGALAQQPSSARERGGWGMAYTGMYDPKTVETVRGEVVSVERVPPTGRAMGRMTRGAHYGIHLIMKTGMETIPVHLGPAWYIDNQAVKIAPKDKIEVKGSRIMFEGKPALVAAELRKGNEVLTLRDANGFPVWVGWRRR
ncbi:MAG TPA: hypothetical protein VFI81_11860 [Rhodanobacteraceae bacterium]|nr:hypothetical protein [Rhodanobacteraceae bacterium]